MFYFIKTPWWLKKLYPSYIWNVKTKEKILFLTFDDGPHPEVTTFVLDALKNFNAKATFFCVGKNVVAYPEVYRRILDEGHSVGNHGHSHLNGWKTNDKLYLDDISEATHHIDSNIFRPPYGRITSFQAKHIGAAMNMKEFKIIMWDVISADFDENISNDDCLQNVILNTKPGSIIVFHDSEKAFGKLKYALPNVLKFFGQKGYDFQKMDG